MNDCPRCGLPVDPNDWEENLCNRDATEHTIQDDFPDAASGCYFAEKLWRENHPKGASYPCEEGKPCTLCEMEELDLTAND